MHSKFFLGVVLGLWAMPAWAGKITAELDRTEVEIGEAAVLTVTIEGERDGEPALPDVPGLIMNQQGYSESTVISNGRRVSELSLTLVVRAQKAGDFTIPSIVAMLDGEREATLPLALKVVVAGTGSGQAGSGAGAAAPPNTPKNAPKGAEDNGGVFVERECAKTDPYVGEQVVCAIRIFHRGNLNGGQRPGVNSPDFRRFSVEGEGRYQRVVGGQRYAVIELKDVVVPTKAGSLTLPPFTLEARILTWTKKGNSLNKFFDRFGGGMLNFDMNFTEEKQVTIQSEATQFDVRPLPEDGKPAGFQGVVGRYDLTTDVSSRQVGVGDTVTVTVGLSGEGVLDTAGEPPLDLKRLGKVYPDKPEYKESITGDAGVSSSKTFRFAVVPDKAGDFPLGSVDIPVFNPALGSYVTLHADLGTLLVQQGDVSEKSVVVGNGGAVDPGASRTPVKEVGTDLLGPHASSTMKSKQTITSYFLINFCTIASVPWLLSFTVLGLRARRRRADRDSPALRRSLAFRRFRASMEKAAAGANQSPMVSISDAHRAFRSYVGDKVDKHGGALAAKELDDHLATLGATDSIRNQAKRVVDLLEQVEFGGRHVRADEAAALLRDLEGVAEAMEIRK